MLIIFTIIIFSVILHEIAHGLIAERLGDPTARNSGRLTLNPVPHIDPLMSLLLPALLLIIGSPVVIGGAKPVPINPNNFAKPKKDIALTSLAGPLINLLIALFVIGLLRLIYLFYPVSTSFAGLINGLNYAVIINFSLALFNLLPIPPLDGFKILGALVPDKMIESWYSLERYFGLVVIFLLILFGGEIFSFVSKLEFEILRIFA